MADKLNHLSRLKALCLQATEDVQQAVETKSHRADKNGYMAMTLNSWQPRDRGITHWEEAAWSNISN